MRWAVIVLSLFLLKTSECMRIWINDSSIDCAIKLLKNNVHSFDVEILSLQYFYTKSVNETEDNIKEIDCNQIYNLLKLKFIKHNFYNFCSQQEHFGMQ